MRVLVTNDDGIDAPGLRVLAVEIAAAGHEVVVLAPTDDRSGSGAGLARMHRDGRVELRSYVWDDVPGGTIHAIDAPPASAVLAACHGALGAAPEVVVSGINPGANTGQMLIHSGTVGAALTGAAAGVPGIAVSLAVRFRDSEDLRHWSSAAVLATAAIAWVVEPDDHPRVLNLNVPNRPRAEIAGVREASLALGGEVWVASADHDAGDIHLDFRGTCRDIAPGSDVAWLRDGYATVTALGSLHHLGRLGAADHLNHLVA